MAAPAAKDGVEAVGSPPIGYRRLLLALPLAGMAAFGAMLQSGASQPRPQQTDCRIVISTGSIYIASNCGDSGTSVIGPPNSERTTASTAPLDERNRNRRSVRGAIGHAGEAEVPRTDRRPRQPNETGAKRGSNQRPENRSAPRDRKRAGKTAGGEGPVLIAVGDIADCAGRGDEATAALAQRIDGTVATLGDHAYNSGSRQQFEECYDPSWGRMKTRTRPSPGNHDYGTRNAKGYFDYFGEAAGAPGKGYYSYDLGTWHIIVLNSMCEEVGGCDTRSPQGRWLRADLAAHPAACTLAYWHHPLFSSGKEHGGEEAMRPAWELLYQAGADVVLSGHEHNYERFAPQDPNGRLNAQRGIRQFVVGTGGKSLYGFGSPLRTSEVRSAETFGVLVLTLRPQDYEWTFIPVGAKGGNRNESRVVDQGSDDCH